MGRLRDVAWAARHRTQLIEMSKWHESVLYGPVLYGQDGIVTSQTPSFQQDPRFLSALGVAKQTGQLSGDWRTAVYSWFADIACRQDGDLVECGVAYGGSARAAIDFVGLQRTTKTFYLMDTFDGLDPAQVGQQELDAGVNQYVGRYRGTLASVRRNFAGFNVKIIPGRIPDTLPLCPVERICFLSIDMNCVAPEVAALEHFWDRVVAGGVIIHDDFGFPMHKHQRLAFEAFSHRVHRTILPLPTGQGILVK